MKKVLSTFAALSIATGIALVGSAATAGNDKITYSQNGITWSTSQNTTVFASRTRDRVLSEHRHGGHFGSPTHGSFGKQGTYTKPLYNALNINERRSKKRVQVPRN